MTQEDLEPQTALQGLRRVLGKENLSWDTLVDVVDRSLRKARREGKGEQQTVSSASPGASSAYDWDDNRYNL
jgi:hypothetical protein